MCYGNVPPHTGMVGSLLMLIASRDHLVQNWSHYSTLLRTLAN